ncbi:MAG: DNA mismatch repair endonuclease MutL [Massilibacteroides sp.]|nr:DNA mismatch repair endonuclease MutL [Massilibacteroides sp.]
MTDIIHLLPDPIANQIAAGEVINRPSSVVKELVENAIDSEAKTIQIVIKDAGRTLVQVIDDGKGMSETDARMAFERHATSKIKTAKDLYDLHTMGFRGEALASIAAVAQVELNTRREDKEMGIHLELANSQVIKAEPIGCDQGSNFKVKNLFFNVPARRKFLKTEKTELRHILTQFKQIAYVNPSINFFFYHNGEELFNLPASPSRQRIIDISGKNINKQLLTIDVNSELVNIKGFIGRPESAKKYNASQYFFVNGRYMRHPYFHNAVMKAYDQLIPKGENPIYFLFFTLAPDSIDVNVHPTKTEIKFENEQPIWQIIMAAVRETLAKSSAVPTIDFQEDQTLDIPVFNQTEKKVESFEAPDIKSNGSYNPFDRPTTKQMIPSGFEWSKLYDNFENAKEEAIENTLSDEEEERRPINEEGLFTAINVNSEVPIQSSFSLGQYKARYILTILKSGLALIDQHRAHLRVLFDQSMLMLQEQKSVSQQCLFPQIIEFSHTEAEMLTSIKDKLNAVGFQMEKEEDNFTIKGIPTMLERADIEKLLRYVIEHVSEMHAEAEEEVNKVIALSLAKSSSIVAGKILSKEEMEKLVADLFSSTNPNLTPEGKAIMIILSDTELEQRFNR